MFSSNDTISVRQLRLLLILDLFSTTSLIMPRIATESAGRDGWISVIIGTLIAFIYLSLIMHVVYKFPKETLIEYSKKLLGKIISFIIGVIFIVKLILLTSFGVRFFGELIKETLLNDTPIEIIIVSMLLVVTYVARKGFECRARIVEILIWIIFIPIILVLLFALPNVNFDQILPVLVNEPIDIFYGAFAISITYSAIILLLIAIPYTNKPQKTKRSVNFSLVFVGLFNLVLCLITIGLFGEEGTRRQIWPVMNIMQVTKLPGAFIERQDALMIAFWIMSFFAVLNSYVFFISVLTQRLFRLKEQNFLVLPYLPIIYLISLIPDNVVQVYEWTKSIMMYLGVFFLVFLPLIFIILSRIRKVGEHNAVD